MTETPNLINSPSPQLPVGDGASDVNAQLERILATPEFVNSAQLSDFLRYVVERHLAGDGSRLKGYTIAVEALGRSQEFDPRSDPIVRVVATRVRKALDYYYMAFGQSDPLLISIPRGSYQPVITPIDRSEPLHAQAPERKPDIPTPASTPGPAHPAASVDLVRSPIVPDEPMASQWRRYAALAVVLLATAFAANWVWQRESHELAGVVPPSGPRIAVLPFANASGDDSLDVFAYGLSFELVSALARVRTLSVYADTDSAIGIDDTVFGSLPKKLEGVDYVLQGLLRRSENSIAIDHILLDAHTAKVVWTANESVSLATSDFLDSQHAVVQAVVGELSGGGDGVIVDLEIARANDHSGVSVDAYRCVLSVHSYWRTFSKKLHLESRTCLEQTIERFPKYALAHVRLAALYLDEHKFGMNAREGYVPLDRSVTTINTAITLDSDSLQARNTLFNIEMASGNTEKALEIGRGLIKDNPNDAVFLANFGSKLGYGLGQWEEGIVYSMRALGVVRNAPAWYFIAPAYHAIEKGQYDAALNFADKMNDHLVASALIPAIVYGMRKDREQTTKYIDKLAVRSIVDVVSLQQRMKRWSMSPALKEKVIEYMNNSFKLASDV